MKLKLESLRQTALLLLFVSSPLFSYEVLSAAKDIKFKEKIVKQNVILKSVDTLSKNCTPLSLNDLEHDTFTATHYIFKDSTICTSDAAKYEKESVLFDFGLLQIEQEGKIIYENDQFIRMKKHDGTVEKIYKNGKIE